MMDAERQKYQHTLESSVSIVKIVRGAASYPISQHCSARANLNPTWGWIYCLFIITRGSLQRQSKLYAQGKPYLLSQGVLKVFISPMNQSHCA